MYLGALQKFCLSSGNIYLSRLSRLPMLATYNSIAGDGMGGAGLTLIPKSGKYSRVILWMHGLGDTAQGWVTLMPQILPNDTKYILPTADSRPVTINNGFEMTAWYDVLDLKEDGDEDKEGLRKALPRINSIISNEIKNGIPASQIVVGGFSQGGSIALCIALRSNVKLGGCCVIGTWCAVKEDYPKSFGSAATSIPIWFGHGDADTMVPCDSAGRCVEFLKSKGLSPEFEVFKDVGHYSNPEQMAQVRKFIEKALTPEYVS